MISALALFCDDIREERSGQVSVIGIYTDNITVESVPLVLPKLAVYMRISLSVDEPAPKMIATRLVQTDNKEIPFSTFESDIIEKAIRESREKGASRAGLIGTAIMPGFRVRQMGRMNVIAKIEDQELICGTLNVQVKD